MGLDTFSPTSDLTVRPGKTCCFLRCHCSVVQTVLYLVLCMSIAEICCCYIFLFSVVLLLFALSFLYIIGIGFGDSETSSIDISNPSSGRSSRSSLSPAKYPATTAPQRQTGASIPPTSQAVPPIHFPLMEEYDFKITCRHCFAKIGEGIKGLNWCIKYKFVM